MDIEDFEHLLKYVNITGNTLNIEERMHLQLAFLTLKNVIGVDEVYFWGKIIGKQWLWLVCLLDIGTVKDYYVVAAIDNTEIKEGFAQKKFYWCSSSNFVFAQLPEVIPNMRDKFNLMTTFLTGEYDRILIEGQG